MLTDKKNAFDLLRLLLAFSVIITHAYLIGGYKASDPLSILSKGQTNMAEIGVMGFFTLSGYLITASYERTQKALSYIAHRFLRIFPGYWICLVITAFVIAPLVIYLKGSPTGGLYTGNDGSLSFVLKNFLLEIKQWSVKDALSSAAYQESLNGSLWSLYPEMQCYVFTLIAGWFGLFNKNKMLLLLIFISIAIFYAVNAFGIKNYGPTLLILSPALKLYTSYLAGAVLYTFKTNFKLDVYGSAFAFLFMLLLLKFGGFHLLSPLLIAITLISTFQLFRVTFKYDVSYGVYIYAFPIQQLLYQVFGHNLNIIVFILLSFILSAVLGLASFILIEKPFINLKPKVDRLFNT